MVTWQVDHSYAPYGASKPGASADRYPEPRVRQNAPAEVFWK